ncbi:MAG: MBL fold metallo-hydrolase [Opitutaceae bacterium]
MHPNTSALSRRDALRFLGLVGAATFLPSLATRAVAGPDSGTSPAGSLPDLAGEQAGYFRFKIGALDAVALLDGGFGGPLAQAPWPAAGPGKLAEALGAAFLPTDSFGIPFSVLLVRMGSELVLIDSGCGGLFGPANGKLVRRLEAIGVRPAQITAVFLSHAHADHFGGLLDAETKQPVFTHAQHFIHRREFETWTDRAGELSAAGVAADSIAGAQACLNALKPRWQLVAPGDKLIDGLEILDAPGHTPGHIAFAFGSGDTQLLHFVDIAHHHAISFAHPEVPIVFDVQPQIAAATRRKFLDRAAADRTRVFGAHMPFPALGHVRKLADHYEYVVEPAPAV